MFNIETHITPDTYEMISSNGEEFKDGGIYVGTSGSLVYYYKKIKYYQSKNIQEEVKEALEGFQIAFETNLEVWKMQSMKTKQIASFFLGMPGLLTLGYLVFSDTNKTHADEWLGRLLDYCELPIQAGELLYGHTGLLYCLLLIKSNNPELSKIDEVIKNITIELIHYGINEELDDMLNNNESTLYYEFYHTPYLGAAHGFFGIIYMILKAFEFIPLQEIPNKLQKLVFNTCVWLLKFQNEEGNFPSTEFSAGAELVHFCHGAPGSIPFLLQAYEFYQDDRFLESAIKAGNVVFTKGIVKKGNNLCHGIAGNSYSLFTLARVTGDEQWKYKAYWLVNATYMKSVLIKCAKYKDPTRRVTGTADTIYSLMEGRMGLAVLYLDVLTDDDSMKFPGYEI